MISNNIQNVDLSDFIYIIQKDKSQNQYLSPITHRQSEFSFFCLCLWYANQGGGRLSTKDFKALIETSEHWQQSIIHNVSQLNHHVQNLDSDSVRQDSRALVDFALTAGYKQLQEHAPAIMANKKNDQQKLKDGCHNLIRYLKCHNVPYTPELELGLQDLLKIVFFNCEVTFITETFEQVIKKAKIRSRDFYQLSIANL